jgi:hypothetical protein
LKEILSEIKKLNERIPLKANFETLENMKV